MSSIIHPGDAERLLNDPDFNKVWDYMEEMIVNSMVRSPIGEKDQHHELVLSLQLLRNYKKVLTTVATNDKVEEFNTRMANKVV